MNYQPQPGIDARTSNAQMAARIMAMPVQPYTEGGYVLRVAEIRGRKSGEMIQVPIAVITLNNSRYLVSPKIDRPWVRNMLAASTCTIIAGSDREGYRAERVSGLEAVGVLRLYMRYLNWVLDQFPFPPDAPETQMLDKLEKVAVFRLVAETD